MSRCYELELENGGFVRVNTSEFDGVEVLWSPFDEWAQKLNGINSTSGMFQEALDGVDISEAKFKISELRKFFRDVKKYETADNFQDILKVIRKRDPEFYELIKDS